MVCLEGQHISLFSVLYRVMHLFGLPEPVLDPAQPAASTPAGWDKPLELSGVHTLLYSCQHVCMGGEVGRSCGGWLGLPFCQVFVLCCFYKQIQVC